MVWLSFSVVLCVTEFLQRCDPISLYQVAMSHLISLSFLLLCRRGECFLLHFVWPLFACLTLYSCYVYLCRGSGGVCHPRQDSKDGCDSSMVVFLLHNAEVKLVTHTHISNRSQMKYAKWHLCSVQHSTNKHNKLRRKRSFCLLIFEGDPIWSQTLSYNRRRGVEGEGGLQ